MCRKPQGLQNVSSQFTSQTYNQTNPTDGTVVLGGASPRTITYTGLDPIITFGATPITFNLPNLVSPLGNNDVTLTDLGAGRAILAGSTFESVAFDVPLATQAITINLGSGNDVLTIVAATLNATTNLIIDGQGGTDAVHFNAVGGLSNVGVLTVSAETIDQTTAISAAGAASFTTTNALLLNNAGNNFNTLTATSAGAVTILDANSLSVGAVTGAGVSISAKDALTLTGAINAGAGTVSLAANTDVAGNDALLMLPGSSVTTTNDTASAVSITANTTFGGTGSITLLAVFAGTTAGVVTVDANMGAVIDGNVADNNITAGNAVLRGLAGVGTLLDPIETTISRVEGAGATGGFFLQNAGTLAVGGIGSTVGLTTTTGAIDVRTAAGSLTVEENVSSTSGNITLKANDLAAAGNDLTINAGVTVLSTLGNITLQAGDNVTLASGSVINATAGKIAITSDSGDLDAGTGTTLTVAAQLVSSTGTTITGGGDNDNYAISYPTGTTNSGTVTLSDAAGTDAVVINGTAGADSLFFTTANPPTTLTTEQVTRGNSTSEPITLPSTIESLRLNGLAGNDTFNVQPSKLFPVTVDGGSPVLGDLGVPPGDTLAIDMLGNTFSVVGTNIVVNGGFLPLTPISIESLVLSPTSAGPAQRYDFNHQTLNSTLTGFVQTPTQAGYTPVARNTLYSAALGYGWSQVMESVTGGTNTAADAALVNDGHLYHAGISASFPQFKANIGNGFVQATVTFGHPGLAMDGLTIVNADTNEVLASGLSTTLGKSSHVTVYALVTDGTLDLRFQDTLNSRMIVISGLDIRPATLFSLRTTSVLGTLPGDGNTVDPLAIIGGAPNSLITVSTTLGTITNVDADPHIAGIQLATNGSGGATLNLKRPSSAGTAVVSLSSPTGEGPGVIQVNYTVISGFNFDFNAPGSPHFDPISVANLDGYVGVQTTNLYSPAAGFGWVSQPDAFVISPALAGSNSALISDGHRGGNAGTFKVDIANGTYDVHVYMGDSADHAGVTLVANGTTVIDNLPLTHNTITERTFPVTVTGGQLSLTFSRNNQFILDPHWVINGIEIRTSVVTVGTITPTPNIGSVAGNGTTITPVNATSTLTPGTFVTVSSTLGTITTADADLGTAGIQVVVDPVGAITFNLQSPNSAGTPTIDWLSMDGGAHTTITSAAFLSFATPGTRKFDFNTGYNNATMSPTEPGFIGVRTNHQSPATDGFGWVAPAPETFDFTGTLPAAFAPAALHRDGVRGTTNTTAQFRVQALPATNYSVLVYVGAYGLNLDNVRVTVEGQPSVTAAATDWDQRTTVMVSGANDLNGDGYISIVFADPSVGGTRQTGWAVTGLEVVQLPLFVPLTAAIVVDQSSAAVLSTSDLANVLSVAKSIVGSGSLTAAQRNDLAAVNVSTADLNGLRALGQTSGTSIVIDDNGAGLGWSTRLDGVDAGEYDLLTTVVHELGHVIGLDHSAEGVMSAVLNPGERADEIDNFFASDLGNLLD